MPESPVSTVFLLAIAGLMLPLLCGATDISGMGRDNSLLICMVPDIDGKSTPEDLRRIGIQPNKSGTVWLPVESGFARPRIESLDSVALFDFLVAPPDPVGRNELLFTSTIRPVDMPPLAAESIPVEGSGGQLDNLFFPEPDPTIPPGFIEPDQMGAVDTFIETFGLGRCDVTAEWTELPDTFFPRFYAGSKCLNRNGMPSCSFPPVLQCEPNISTPNRLAYITVLRWDCCWSFIRRRWEWQCGWRKVEIPIIVNCICACSAKLRNS